MFGNLSSLFRLFLQLLKLRSYNKGLSQFREVFQGFPGTRDLLPLPFTVFIKPAGFFLWEALNPEFIWIPPLKDSSLLLTLRLGFCFPPLFRDDRFKASIEGAVLRPLWWG